jgi:hypothetical protein
MARKVFGPWQQFCNMKKLRCYYFPGDQRMGCWKGRPRPIEALMTFQVTCPCQPMAELSFLLCVEKLLKKKKIRCSWALLSWFVFPSANDREFFFLFRSGKRSTWKVRSALGRKEEPPNTKDHARRARERVSWSLQKTRHLYNISLHFENSRKWTLLLMSWHMKTTQPLRNDSKQNRRKTQTHNSRRIVKRNSTQNGSSGSRPRNAISPTLY